MKNLILFSALAAVLSLSASASESYIYWMMPDNVTCTEGWGGDQLSGSYTARIAAFDGSTWGDTADAYLTLWSSGAGGVKGIEIGNYVGVKIGGDADNLPYYVSLANASGEKNWTFFVELYNDKGGIVAHSEGLPYAEASIAALGGLKTPGTAWAPTAFVPAPEPNSALLLLIGCAALALRRRRQIAA